MELATKRVIWFAVTDSPDAPWVSQQARNLAWELTEIGLEARFSMRDHDAKFGSGSDNALESPGLKAVTTPIAAPRANAHIERQVGSTRRECLDWLVIIGHRHMERVLTAWFEHYNQARPHRGLDLRTPIARSDPVIATLGRVVCRDVLGGLLREYSLAPLPMGA